MKCANPKCRTTEMKNNRIKIIKIDGIIIYFCSQECFNKFNNVKFDFRILGKMGSFIDWKKVNMGGF